MKNTLKLYTTVFISLLLFSCTKEIEVSIINPDIDMMDDLSGEGIISEFALINDIGLELIPVNQSIDQEEKTISLEYSFGTDVSSLFTKIKISDEATITPKEGEKVDFTQPVNFIVTAANGTENTYTVIATTPALSEKQALLNMASPFPDSRLNWSADTDITTWNDITVENGHVTELKIPISTTSSINFTSDIKNLIHLKSISLSNFPSDAPTLILPVEIGSLKQLESFTANSVLNEFPEALVMNINLKSITIFNGGNINKIPENIGNLKKLETLNLRSTAIDEIPESISELVMLKNLDLSGSSTFRFNKIQELPVGFDKLVNLEELNLSGNQLLEIPNTIGNLSKLKTLNLTNNSLSRLPESIGELTNLKTLGIAINKLKTIPNSITKLINLPSLDLNTNEIESLPEIGINIKSLNLGKNKLKIIPEQIGNLINLTFLNLASNIITEIPSNLSKLTKLEALFLNDNPDLKSIPQSVCDLENTGTLITRGPDVTCQ